MKTFLRLCLVAAVAASVSAQWSLPGIPPWLSPSNYLQLVKTITDLHRALSNTPLAPYLPSVPQMIMDAIRFAGAARDFQDGVRKASESLNNAIKKAAEQANLPPGSVDFNQLGQMLTQALQPGQGQNVGQAVSNFIQSEAP